jgi:N-acetylglucosamine-6-sulfatase
MRRLVALVVGLVLAVALTSCAAPRPTAPTPRELPTAGAKPNFVFVLTDDLSWNLVSHMPHVEALQQAGETMSKYSVVDSLCCPSRSAIFTGEYPHDDGVYKNGGPDGGYGAYNRNGDEQKTFALSLQKAGYTTGFMGKYLNGYQPTDPTPPGWNEWDVSGSNGYPEFDYDLSENGTVEHYGHAPSDYMVDVLSQKAGSFIETNAQRKSPFMLEVATFAPHAPYTPAPRYAGTESALPYPKTAAYDALPTDPPSWLKKRPPLTAADKQHIQTAYDKRVEADLSVDDMVGHLEDELKAEGVAQNTYFVFSSDNGYHMGEYRLLPGKQTAFDTDVHVPLIVSGPSVPAGRTNTQMTSSIDLAPTFETLAGATIGASVDGVSMASLWHGLDPPDWQQAVLIEHRGMNDARGDPDAQKQAHGDPPTYEAIRTADALYVRYANGEVEYYDTVTDPDELHNLGGAAVPPDLVTALTALQHCHDAEACQAAARLPG